MAEADCEVACTNCERCAKDSPEGLITMVNNLAVVDYRKNGLASRIAVERCPTGAWDMQKSTVLLPYAIDEAAKERKRSA